VDTPSLLVDHMSSWWLLDDLADLDLQIQSREPYVLEDCRALCHIQSSDSRMRDVVLRRQVLLDGAVVSHHSVLVPTKAGIANNVTPRPAAEEPR
jgi:hypothetical protein